MSDVRPKHRSLFSCRSRRQAARAQRGGFRTLWGCTTLVLTPQKGCCWPTLSHRGGGRGRGSASSLDRHLRDRACNLLLARAESRGRVSLVGLVALFPHRIRHFSVPGKGKSGCWGAAVRVAHPIAMGTRGHPRGHPLLHLQDPLLVLSPRHAEGPWPRTAAEWALPQRTRRQFCPLGRRRGHFPDAGTFLAPQGGASV